MCVLDDEHVTVIDVDVEVVRIRTTPQESVALRSSRWP
jgi:hypothetical protein